MIKTDQNNQTQASDFSEIRFILKCEPRERLTRQILTV